MIKHHKYYIVKRFGIARIVSGIYVERHDVVVAGPYDSEQSAQPDFEYLRRYGYMPPDSPNKPR